MTVQGWAILYACIAKEGAEIGKEAGTKKPPLG
jgi:hypothetical protein